MTLQSKKYLFYQIKINFLGIIISKDSVQVNSTKIKGISEWLEPKDKWEVQQFLEFCNFYKCFIKEFAYIAKPLIEMTRIKE